MILIDANLLIYAHVAEMPQHSRARSWLEEQLNGLPRVGLPWHSLLAFLRIVTNPRVFERPEAIEAAWAQVREWLDLEPVWIPQPSEAHAAILERQLARIGSASQLVADAHLAALALEHGLTLCSADGDFGRFPDLRWENPLA
jgi:toxin-antitoxin system PIN domain toxin